MTLTIQKLEDSSPSCRDPSTAQPDAPNCGAEEKVELLQSG